MTAAAANPTKTPVQAGNRRAQALACRALEELAAGNAAAAHALRRQAISAMIPLFESIASRWIRRGVPLTVRRDDLINEAALLALCHFFDYDPANATGATITSYIATSANKHFRRYLAHASSFLHAPDPSYKPKTAYRGGPKPTAEPIDTAYEIAGREPTPAELAEAHELAESVRRAVALLHPRYQRVLLARYGIGQPAHSLKQLAYALGLTKERVRQLEARALDLLRSQLERTAHE